MSPNLRDCAKRVKGNTLDRTPRRKKLGQPTLAEQKMIDELRSQVLKLPEPGTGNGSPAENAWLSNVGQLRQSILRDDPRNFLEWDVIARTMVYEPPVAELKYLQGRSDWKRWKRAILECPTGNPKPYAAFRKSSGTLIHHAYSLSLLMQKVKCTIDEMPQIVEFGGGYGSMCRLVYQLGFIGRYVIFDLPELIALQEYFLKSVGISKKISTGASPGVCIAVVSNIKELSRQLENENGNCTFIATWSISETSEKLRSLILDIIGDAQYFLIAYQDNFGEVNNLEYFSRFAAMKKGYQWFEFEIPHLPGNRYLIGKRTADYTHDDGK